MYVNNNLSGAGHSSYIKASGFTPIIDPSAINYKDENIANNKAIGRPTANPPMSLVPGIISPNWSWSHLGFYQRQVDEARANQLQGVGNLDITQLLVIAKNGNIDEIKSKISATDAATLISQANMLGIKLDPTVLAVLNSIKDQANPGGASDDKAPVKIVGKNDAKYMLYGLGALVVGGIGYLMISQPKTRRR